MLAVSSQSFDSWIPLSVASLVVVPAFSTLFKNEFGRVVISTEFPQVCLIGILSLSIRILS